MVGTIVHVHVFDNATAQTVFGEHALHHLDIEGVITGFDVLVERFLHQELGGSFTLATGIACVRKINAVGHFFTGEHHLVGVYDNHVVAALHVGRVGRLVFAAQNLSHL